MTPGASDLARERLRAAALFAVVFAVYAWGACRTVYVGDSGDLATAVAVLGIPHPSGYPLYVLAGKLWSLLFFFLPLAFALSLFSAAAAAGAVALVYRTARDEGVGLAGSLFAGLLLAFGQSLWGEANVQRVYALNALFLAAAARAALRWRRERHPRDLVATALLCGLGASNHLYMAVFGGVFAVYAIAVEPSLLRRPGLLAAAAGAGLLGLLPYAYLPLRARAEPLLAWGDPRTPGNFAKVVLRESFWQRRYFESARDLLPIGDDFARSLFLETAWIGVPLAAIALVAARRRRFPVALPLAAIAADFAIMALHGSRTDLFVWHRYYVPSYLMLALLAAFGVDVLLAFIPPGAGILAFLPPAVLLVSNFREFDRSRYRIAESYSEILLRTLPPGSRLIASDDNILFVLMYLNLGEAQRPDIDLILEGVGGARLPPLRFDPDVDRVFVTHHPNWGAPGLEMVPVGLAFEAWRAGRPWPAPLPVPEWLDGERDPRVPRDYLTQNLIGEFHYMRGVTFERRNWLAARLEFARAVAAAPSNDVLFYNLGLIYRRNGLYPESLAAFRRSEAINPREIASLSKPRAADRVAEVSAEAGRLEALEERLAGEDGLPIAARSTAAGHRRIAVLLAAQGEVEAARGHALRAVEAAAAAR